MTPWETILLGADTLVTWAIEYMDPMGLGQLGITLCVFLASTILAPSIVWGRRSPSVVLQSAILGAGLIVCFCLFAGARYG